MDWNLWDPPRNNIDRPFFRQNAPPNPAPNLADTLGGWPEIHEIADLMPDVRGHGVVDFGGHTDTFCRAMIEMCYARYAHGFTMTRTGTMVSQDLLIDPLVAPPLRYIWGNLQHVYLHDNNYHLVFSRGVFDGLPDILVMQAFRVAFRTLVPGGEFIFSISHPHVTMPMTTADPRPRGSSHPNIDIATETDMISVTGFLIHHRPLQAYLRALIDCGFVWPTYREYPDGQETKLILVIRATKPIIDPVSVRPDGYLDTLQSNPTALEGGLWT